MVVVPSGGPIQIILVVLTIVGAFFLGSLWTKVGVLETKGNVSGGGVAAPTVQPNEPAPQKAQDVPKVTSKDHIRGDKNAKLALIEYSDIECPFCKRFHPTLKQMLDEYKGKVMWVYRDFPLGFHANAQKEAEATECAGELGGEDMYWKYLDTLFERTTSNGTGFALDALVPLAKELGLNEGKFRSCLDSGKYLKQIQEEIQGGSRAGVTGTPGSILLDTASGDTQLISGAVPYEQVKQAIETMLR